MALSSTSTNEKRGMSKIERRNLKWGLLFISPWLIGFIVYEIGPLIASFYYSLTRYDLIREPVFLGFDNYVNLFTDDPNFPTVLYNTLYYVGFGVGRSTRKRVNEKI